MTSNIKKPDIADISAGVNSILKMLDLAGQKPFPRNIMTSKYNAFTVYDMHNLINVFQQSNFENCRISAYPPFSNNSLDFIPNVLLLDLDFDKIIVQNHPIQAMLTARNSANISSKVKVNKILKRLQLTFNISNFMVMFTGNGRHIVVVFAFDRPFEKIADFQRYIGRLPPTSSLSINPISKEFLRYAKDYLSNGQADAANHPNFRSMSLRVPGTINTKIKGQYELVRLEHDIDYISPISGFKDLHNTLISGFMDHLDDLSLAYKIKLDSRDQRQRKISKVTSIEPTPSLSYQYVDKLLQTPVKDHREFCIWRILGPYLLNIKYLSYESTFKIIMDWLSKCDALSSSKFYNEESVRTRLDKVGSFLPLTEASLRSLNRELYNMIITQ